MKRILFILSIFGASLFMEALPSEAVAATPSTESVFGIFGDNSGVSHKSARRFKAPRRQRRSKFACMRKHGCHGHTVKSKHINDNNCKKRM